MEPRSIGTTPRFSKNRQPDTTWTRVVGRHLSRFSRDPCESLASPYPIFTASAATRGSSRLQSRQTGRVARGEQVRLADVAPDHIGRAMTGLGHDRPL